MLIIYIDEKYPSLSIQPFSKLGPIMLFICSSIICWQWECSSYSCQYVFQLALLLIISVYKHFFLQAFNPVQSWYNTRYKWFQCCVAGAFCCPPNIPKVCGGLLWTALHCFVCRSATWGWLTHKPIAHYQLASPPPPLPCYWQTHKQKTPIFPRWKLWSVIKDSDYANS